MIVSQAVPAIAAEKLFKRDNETELTYRLKRSAWEWLYTISQCRCIGTEVRLEGPAGTVVDLVGVGPGNVIYIVEVKATRADFGRDNHTIKDLEALKSHCQVVAGHTELARNILIQAAAYAKMTQSGAWRGVFAYRQALADYRRMVRRQRAYKAKIATYSTKFHDDRFLRIADYHYIIAPRHAVSHRWVPPQWGLLDETCKVVVPAPKKPARKNTGILSNVLRAIARSNTTSMMRAQGVLFAEDVAVFPQVGPND